MLELKRLIIYVGEKLLENYVFEVKKTTFNLDYSNIIFASKIILMQYFNVYPSIYPYNPQIEYCLGFYLLTYWHLN